MTVSHIFLYCGAAIAALWGIVHLFPTRSIVKGFGYIGADNRRIITMEWIVEGVTLIFMGLFVTVVTVIDPSGPVSKAVYILTAAGLITLATVSLFTGFKVDFTPFKLCPFLFTASAALIVVGGIV
jgi:hypothetical protein